MALTTEEVRDLAALLRARSSGAPLSAQRPEHQPWVRVLAELGRADVLEVLRGVEFRPYLLLNGLLHASALEEAGLRFTCAVLANGLEEFAGYFVAKARGGEADPKALGREQHRYFAWLIAQWPECDVDMGGVLMTMKADAADPDAAYQIRAILEEGPLALMASDLFNSEEKEAFTRLLQQEPGSWEALRDLMIRLWKVPVVLAPPREVPPERRN